MYKLKNNQIAFYKYFSNVTVLLLMCGAAASTALAEPIDKIVEGAFYYQKGFKGESKVQVIGIDEIAKRVKVLNSETLQIDWVDADTLVTGPEPIQRDINSTELFGSRLFPSLLTTPYDSDLSEARANWKAGVPHPQHPNVIASAEFNKWEPKPGYAWNPLDSSWTVRWQPGTAYPGRADLVASFETEKWTTLAGYNYEYYDHWLQIEKQKDQDRIAALPWPSDVKGTLLDKGEFDLYTNKSIIESVAIYHEKPIDYELISHVEYHIDHHWIVIAMMNGDRFALGDHINAEMRPGIRGAHSILIARRKNGVEIASKRVQIFPISTKHPKVIKKYAIGVWVETFMKSGNNAFIGLKINDVLMGSPGERLGLQAGDIIVELNGNKIKTRNELNRQVKEANGNEIPIRYMRENKLFVKSITPELMLSLSE